MLLLGMGTRIVLAQQDPQATTILNGVSATYKAYNSVQATFNLKVENAQDVQKDNQYGVLAVSGKKFKVSMTNQDIICNGGTIWTYFKSENSVTIDDYEPDENSITPSQIFTIWEKNFKYQFVEEKTENGVVVQVIDLTPVDTKKTYFKVRLTINKSLKSLVSARIFDKNGNKYTYTVSTFLANPVLGDSFFNFNAADHPGVTITDNRG